MHSLGEDAESFVSGTQHSLGGATQRSCGGANARARFRRHGRDAKARGHHHRSPDDVTGPVLRKPAIDETDPGEKQLEEFLGSTEPYVAATRRGSEYQRRGSIPSYAQSSMRGPTKARDTGAAF